MILDLELQRTGLDAQPDTSRGPAPECRATLLSASCSTR